MNGSYRIHTSHAGICRALCIILCLCSLLGCVSCASSSTVDSGTQADTAQISNAPQDSESTDTPAADSGENEENVPYIESLTPSSGKRLKIAFIGDSITQGTGATDQSLFSYPIQFSRMVGLDYMVGNFGKASAYVLPYESPYNKRQQRELSYKNTTQYKDSVAFKPDIVIITLGVNDIASMFSESAKKAVKESLIALGRDYESLESVQKVYIATSIRIHSSARAEAFSLGELQSIQRAAAEEGGFGFLDISSMTYDYLDVMMHTTSDRLHPTDALYKEMARAYKAALFEEEFTPTEIERSTSGVVYLKAGGKLSGKGESAENAVGKLAYAAALLGESGGTIVVCGSYPLSYETHMPKTAKQITITSSYGGVDYSSSGAQLTLTHQLYLNGDYRLENLRINSSIADPIIFANFNDLTVDAGVVTGGSAYPVIFAGRNSVSGIDKSYVSHTGECTIDINSGTWAAVIGGNNRANAGCVIGAVEKGASVIICINKGKLVPRGNYCTSAVGMNDMYGTCTLNITGGEITGNVYGLCRGAYTSPALTTVSGSVVLSISGGTIGGSIMPKQDSIPKLTGKMPLTISSTLKDKADGFSDIKVQ